MANGESTVSEATITQRAEALEKKEAEAAAGKGGEGQPDPKEAEAKAAADKAADDKAAADKKADEDAASRGQEKDPKTGKFVAKDKKPANDPADFQRKITSMGQDNKKLRDEIMALKESQEKTYQLLASLSKKPVDYKELAKSPEAIEKFIEEQRDSMSAEFQEHLEKAAMTAKTQETVIARMERERDVENYPEWKRLMPAIQKLSMGPAGTGDPRIDFTKPAGEVLDQMYAIALQESPAEAPASKPADDTSGEKTYKESEMKAMLADMLAKEKEAISKTAKEEARKEAEEALRAEAAGGTVASAGKGAGRQPTDGLAAFKAMTINQQRAWLQAHPDAKPQ